MSHRLERTLAGEAVVSFFASANLTDRAEERRQGVMAAPRAGGLQDLPATYVPSPHIRGTHFPAAAAASPHFGAYCQDLAELRRIWTPELLGSVAEFLDRFHGDRYIGRLPVRDADLREPGPGTAEAS